MFTASPLPKYNLYQTGDHIEHWIQLTIPWGSMITVAIYVEQQWQQRYVVVVALSIVVGVAVTLAVALVTFIHLKCCCWRQHIVFHVFYKDVSS